MSLNVWNPWYVRSVWNVYNIVHVEVLHSQDPGQGVHLLFS